MIKQPWFSQLSFRAKARNPVTMFQVPPRDSSALLPVAQNNREITVLLVALTMSIIPQLHADIPWPEVVQRLAHENDKLARRPQGHNGEYFVVCTLYYTPKESGFTFERGFDATPVTKPGLHGRKYPRDFLRSVKKEGFGRITTPVNGRYYIRYNSSDSYAFDSHVTGGGGVLVPRYSAAMVGGHGGLRRGAVIETTSLELQKIFGSNRWKIMDTGGGLRRWQIDCYFGEDEPLGPGKLQGRPRATTFEYEYANERRLAEKTSIKAIIESCGVPHPEVDLILVDEQTVGFDYTLANDAKVEVFPVDNRDTNRTEKRLKAINITRFVADGHLGGLTRNLRLLGFDVAYPKNADDGQLLDVMSRENRALLTRDRRLLMHGIVQHGYCP